MNTISFVMQKFKFSYKQNGIKSFFVALVVKKVFLPWSFWLCFEVGVQILLHKSTNTLILKFELVLNYLIFVAHQYIGIVYIQHTQSMYPTMILIHEDTSHQKTRIVNKDRRRILIQHLLCKIKNKLSLIHSQKDTYNRNTNSWGARRNNKNSCNKK